MVIHSARPHTARTTQNNSLKTNGPKNPDPSIHPHSTMKSSLVSQLLRIFVDAFFRSGQTLEFRFHFIWFGCNVTDFLTLIVSPCPG